MFKTSQLLLTAALAMSVLLPARSNAQTSSSVAGTVFVMTNAADKNEIITYKRLTDGSLQQGQASPVNFEGGDIAAACIDRKQ